jgi:hypothetical protein
VAQRSASIVTLSPTAYGKGTPDDPHVFAGLVRDHRGLDAEDRARYEAVKTELHARVAQATTSVGRSLWVNALRDVEVGAFPFETFRNIADDSIWGAYFDAARNLLEIRPVPADPGILDRIKDAALWIGDAIVWAGKFVWESLSMICERYREVTAGQKDDLALRLLEVAAPGWGSSVAEAKRTADRICRTVAFVNSIIPRGGNYEEAVDESRPSETVRATRAQPTYPEGSFAVFDGQRNAYRILAPAGAKPPLPVARVATYTRDYR